MPIIYLIQEYYLIFKNRMIGLFRPIPENFYPGNKGDVLMLVGFNENWYFLNTIAKHLNNMGYTVYFPKFNTIDPISKTVKDISKYIDDNHLDDFFIVAHSKGGLISRMILENYSSNIKKVFNIATPHHGTIFGNLYFFSLKEMKPQSDLINQINRYKTDKIINIYPKFDNHVVPNTSLNLNNATNIEVDIVGHTRILESRKLLDLLNTYIH